MIEQVDIIVSHQLFIPAMLLILIGAFTKSAQFPFSIWLPDAMEAPTPISAYLHSATMVKSRNIFSGSFYPCFRGQFSIGFGWWLLPVSLLSYMVQLMP